jgi:DNA polymerase-3 subunit gamma/tau
MLGAVDRDAVYRIVEALAAGDGRAMLAEADALAARGLSPASALDELAALFHRIAVAQVVPEAARHFEDAEPVAALAARWNAEDVQLAYQIATQGRADLAIAPDESVGLAMTLLRLLAFEPARGSVGDSGGGEKPRANATNANLGSVRDVKPRAERVGSTTGSAAASRPGVAARALPDDGAQWPAYVAALRLTGMAAQLAAQTELRAVEGHVVNLRLPASHKHLADRAYADKLKAALEQASGRKLMLAFEVGEAAPTSLASQEKRERDEARERNEAAFRAEPFVRDLVEQFDARIRPDSIKPL